MGPLNKAVLFDFRESTSQAGMTIFQFGTARGHEKHVFEFPNIYLTEEKGV